MCSCDYSNIGAPQFYSTMNNSASTNFDSSSRWRSQRANDDGVGRCSPNCLANPDIIPSNSLSSPQDLYQTFSTRPDLLSGVALVRRHLDYDDTGADQSFDLPFQSLEESSLYRSRNTLPGSNVPPMGNGNATFRMRRGRPPQQLPPCCHPQESMPQSPQQQYLPRMTRATAGGKVLRM